MHWCIKFKYVMTKKEVNELVDEENNDVSSSAHPIQSQHTSLACSTCSSSLEDCFGLFQLYILSCRSSESIRHYFFN